MVELNEKERLTWDKIQQNAGTFSKRWENGWDEKSEAQSFVREFMDYFFTEFSAFYNSTV